MRLRGFGGLARGVTHDDVGDFMAHHARELGFGARVDGADVDVDRAAGQGEGVDLFLLHDLECVGKFVARSFGGELCTEGGDIFRGGVVGREKGEIFFDFLDGLLAELDLLLDGLAARLGIGRDAAFLGIVVGEGREGEGKD